MKQLFLDVQTALSELNSLKWVDKDKGQMNFENPPVLFPAALVTITIPSAENIVKTRQAATAQIAIKLCFDWGGNTSSVTPAAAKAESLKYYDIVDEVFQKMQGWSSDHINPLRRTGMGSLLRPDQYTTEVLTFTGDFMEQVNV